MSYFIYLLLLLKVFFIIFILFNNNQNKKQIKNIKTLLKNAESTLTKQSLIIQNIEKEYVQIRLENWQLFDKIAVIQNQLNEVKTKKYFSEKKR
jgi:hypothetical protein